MHKAIYKMSYKFAICLKSYPSNIQFTVSMFSGSGLTQVEGMEEEPRLQEAQKDSPGCNHIFFILKNIYGKILIFVKSSYSCMDTCIFFGALEVSFFFSERKK